MSTQSPVRQPTGDEEATRSAADAKAVMEHFAAGKPLDPKVVERVRARAEQIRANNFKQHGYVDDETFQSLLDDEA